MATDLPEIDEIESSESAEDSQYLKEARLTDETILVQRAQAGDGKAFLS